MSSYFDIESHHSMIFDGVRNRAYETALQAAVRPDSVVLDLGAGLGIHGLIAALSGAKKVILLDSSPVVNLAAEVAQANGLDKRTEIVLLRAEEIEEIDPVDLIVSVFTGNFLLSEDLLPHLFQVRDRFLKPGGRLIPGKARMRLCLANAPEFHAQHIQRWSKPVHELNFNPVRQYAANNVYFRKPADIAASLLSEPVNVHEIDFATANRAECRCQVEMQIDNSGMCHGLLGWFDMQLGDEWLSTGPAAADTHWSLAFLPLDPPLELSAGDTVRVALDRPENGEWTWTVSRGEFRQRHSTFHSRLLDISHLKRTSPDSTPGLGLKGELALTVIQSLMDGKSVAEIVRIVQEEYPQMFDRNRGMERKIHDLIAEWGAHAN